MLHLKIALVRFLHARFRLSAAELHQVIKKDGTTIYFVVGYIRLINSLYLIYAHQGHMDFDLFLKEGTRLAAAGVLLNQKRIHREEVFLKVFRTHPIIRQNDLNSLNSLTLRIRLIHAENLPTM